MAETFKIKRDGISVWIDGKRESVTHKELELLVEAERIWNVIHLGNARDTALEYIEANILTKDD